jgi:plasmid replication initiation protein
MRKLAQSHRRQSGSPVLRESDLPAMRTHSEPLNRNGVNPHWSKADSTERVALTVFHALPGPMAVRDAQDLMAYPFFSLAKTKRVTPIHFRAGSVAIDVEATSQFGMATIWDADVLIWAASQLVEARDRGLPTSRLMVVTPYEILTFGRRGTSARAYQRLKAALDRLQSTSIATSIRQPTERRLHRFSWINGWTERADAAGRPLGIELVLPDWFYRGLLDDGLFLTIDATYFELTGGIERWLYRLVRKHAGRQSAGWRFDFRYLHAKSGSSATYRNFAIDLRTLVTRQAVPGYQLSVQRRRSREELQFRPSQRRPVVNLISELTARLRFGDKR